MNLNRYLLLFLAVLTAYSFTVQAMIKEPELSRAQILEQINLLGRIEKSLGADLVNLCENAQEVLTTSTTVVEHLSDETLQNLLFDFISQANDYRYKKIRGNNSLIVPLIQKYNKVISLLHLDLLVFEEKVEKIANITCPICFEEKNRPELCVLSCGHEYCKDCLHTILAGALSEHTTASLRCPNPSCKIALEQQNLAQIAQNQQELTQLGDIQLQEWIATQPNAKHCPTPDCPYLFINELERPQQMQCNACHEHYCSECLFNHSERMRCEEAAQHRQTMNPNESDRASEQWKKQNAKQCPHCHAAIEKTEGCSHMTCRNGNCHTEFCWDCLQEWPHARGICPGVPQQINNGLARWDEDENIDNEADNEWNEEENPFERQERQRQLIIREQQNLEEERERERRELDAQWEQFQRENVRKETVQILSTNQIRLQETLNRIYERIHELEFELITIFQNNSIFNGDITFLRRQQLVQIRQDLENRAQEIRQELRQELAQQERNNNPHT